MSGQKLYCIQSINEPNAMYSIDLSSCTLQKEFDIYLPAYWKGDSAVLRDFTFHKDGQIYLINGYYYCILDPKTGQVKPIFTHGENFVLHLLSLDADVFGKLIAGWNILHFYDPISGRNGWNPEPYPTTHFTLYNHFLLAVDFTTFRYINHQVTPLRVLDEWEDNTGYYEIHNISSVPQFCGDVRVYGVGYYGSVDNWQDPSLIEIDVKGKRSSVLCDLPHPDFVGFTSPERVQHPTIRPDFDFDNSSGHMVDGFWGVWSCDGVALLCDSDVEVLSCDMVDSIKIFLDPILEVGHPLFGRSGQDQYTWVQEGNATDLEIEEILRDVEIQTEDISIKKIVKTYFYSMGDSTDIWTVIYPFEDPFQHDVNTVTLCDNGSPIDLDSLLYLDSAKVRYVPALADHQFDPAQDSPGRYQIIRSGDCPDTTLIDITVEKPPVLSSLPEGGICVDQPVILKPDLDESYDFIWQDALGEATREIVHPGKYNYRISKGSCIWDDHIEAFSEENCECSIYVPNAFTPNGDGVNDVFEVYDAGCSEIQLFQIFNQRGTLIYQEESSAPVWTGDKMGMGTFIYMIHYLDLRDTMYKKMYGTVHLVR